MSALIIIAITLALLLADLVSDDQAFWILAIGLTWDKLEDIRRAIIDRKGVSDGDH